MTADNQGFRPWIMIISGRSVLFGLFLVRPYSGQTNLKMLTSPACVSLVNVPQGFRSDLFASDLQEPRFIRFEPDVSLYVAERGTYLIVVLADHDPDGIADQKTTFADQLPSPHSLVFIRMPGM
jgi:hypothetical protein